MRVFLITKTSDSILLRQKSKYIKPNPKNKTLQRFAKRLVTTVRDSASLGVGIAAPQVGILKNIIVVQRLDKDDEPFEVYLNPVIKKYSKRKRPCPEGCLSIPNKRAMTLDRAYEIRIEYDTLDGKHHSESVDDFVSVIFQHEIDHLSGILFIDHLLKEVEDAKN
jgi:peptide deformylase